MITATASLIWISSCLATGIAAGLGYRMIKEKFDAQKNI